MEHCGIDLHLKSSEACVLDGAGAVRETARIPTNLMIAPGYGFGTFLRAELGLVTAFGDAKNSDFDLELRPMLVIAPPVIPVYGRAVFAVTNLLGDGDTIIAYGGAVGVVFDLMDTVGVFAEAGLLPRSVNDTMTWIVEGRAGVYLAF